MEIHEDALVPVELKYCERCGGLWLRSKGEEAVPRVCRRWRSFRRRGAGRGWWCWK